HHHDRPLDAIPAPVAGAVAREVASSSIWPSAYGGPSGARPEAVSIVLPREFLVAIHVAASLRLGARPADIPRCGRKRARSAVRPPCQTYSVTPERKGRDGHRRPLGRGRRRSPPPAAEPAARQGSSTRAARGGAPLPTTRRRSAPAATPARASSDGRSRSRPCP